MIAAILAGELIFPPFTIEDGQVETHATGRNVARITDAVVTLRWEAREFRFAIESKASSTPKAFGIALDLAERGAKAMGLRPMVLVPYLSTSQLQELQARSISGLDLCGNGVVVVPGELLVIRSGAPNRFRAEGRIKNVYRNNSSIAARLFLLWPEFESVSAAKSFIKSYPMSLGTISKVFATLESDLVVERIHDRSTRKRRTRVLQPDKLLDLLARNYSPPDITREFSGKVELTPEEFRAALSEWESTTEGMVVRTGESSLDAYAVMARQDVPTYYCTDVSSLARNLGKGLRETDRFATVRLLETRDNFVYFDKRPVFVASPIQTYLELTAGDKRDRETAEQVRHRIFADLERASVRNHADGHAQ